jgi:hypothetical protein
MGQQVLGRVGETPSKTNEREQPIGQLLSQADGDAGVNG